MSTAAGEKVEVFVPYPLPPRPPQAVGEALRNKLDQTLRRLGKP